MARLPDLGHRPVLFSRDDGAAALCRRLGIPHVPVVNAASPLFDRYPTLNLLMEYADGPGATGRPREGLVFKEAGSRFPVSFKAVSNRYLLGPVML